MVKVGGKYYFRVKVPKNLQTDFSAKEIKKSLYTCNLQNAAKMANLLYSYVSPLFKKVEEGMLSAQQVRSLVNEYVNLLLQRNDEGFVRMAMPDMEWAAADTDALVENYRYAKEAFKRCLANHEYLPATGFLVWLREKKNIEPEDQEEKIRLSREFLKACIKAIDYCIARSKGEYDNDFDSYPLTNVSLSIPEQDHSGNVPAGAMRLVSPASEPNTVGRLMKKFVREKISSGRWSDSTVYDFKAHVAMLVKCLGEDTPVKAITRDQLVDYRENILKRLPVSHKNNPKVKDLSFEQKLDDDEVKKISIKTINAYLNIVTSFFAWCYNERQILSKNPAINLKLKDNRSPNRARKPYSNAELKKIVEKLAGLPKTKGMAEKNIDCTWITLLCMFEGTRENEICQLHIDDIFRVGEIPCLEISASEDGTKRLKNKDSDRIIPIHNQLLRFNFLDFVLARKTKCEIIQRKRKINPIEKIKQKQLFTSMTLDRSKKKYNKNFIYFYNKFKEAISNDAKKSFHSLRHSFASFLENTSEIPYAVSYLAGHSLSIETQKTYTEPDMKILFKELSRLDYGFDICEIFKVEPVSEQTISEQVNQLPVLEE